MRRPNIARIALPRELEPEMDAQRAAVLDRHGGYWLYDPTELGGEEPPADWSSVRALVLPWDAAVSPALPGKLAGLDLLIALGTGVWDYVDVPGLTRRGVAVANTPDYAVEVVAEHTLALLLAVLRDMPRADRMVRSGDWRAARITHRELGGLRLGVIGLGAIGSRVAALGAALGMRVIASTAHPEWHTSSPVQVVDLHTLLLEADVVSLHAAWRGGPPLLGRAELAMMRPGAIVLNTARGRLIDEDALAVALHEGRLGGAGLDVFAEEPPLANAPLLRAPRTVLSPHVAANSTAALPRAASIAFETLLAFYAGEPINIVNPEVLGRALSRR